METKNVNKGVLSGALADQIIALGAEKIIGSGPYSVCVYFYPAYRKAALADGKDIWPCKVLKTETDDAYGINEDAPDDPVIGLVIKTEMPDEVYEAILTALWMTDYEALEEPWFVTSPSRIEKWYLAFVGNLKILKSQI